jgi:hypothetical protein
MDFKALISKLDSMDAPPQTPAAPVLPQAVQLNEDAQLRVLAGQTTYVAEAKKKKEEDVKEEMKVGDKKPSSTGGTIEKTATGVKHHAGKNYGGDKAPKDDEEDAPKAKKAKKESVEPEFKSKFMKMVEAKKEEAEKKKADKKKKMEEGAKPDFLDIDKDGDKEEPMKKAAGEKGGDKKDTDSKSSGLSAKQKKLPPGLQKAIAAKSESKMMPKGKKRPVKESVESTMSFKEMIKLVQESGGQQQIDALDQDLFAWAQRVARNKFDEGMKAEVYAGLVYERMGGRFEMFDVLSEDQK